MTNNNYTIKNMKKILFLILGIIQCLFVANAQIKLSFNPAKGTTYQYAFDMRQSIKQQMMGQDIEMDQVMVMTYDMTVEENNNKEITTSFSYNNIYYELINPMISMKYDSQNTNEEVTLMDDIAGKIFSSLLGKQFKVILLPDGSVKSVSGMDTIIEDMMEAVGNDMIAQQIGAGMKEQFSNEAMKTSFEQSFKIYPTSEIRIGDTWNVHQEMNSGNIIMHINSNYTLNSIKNNKAFVNVTSEIKGMDGQYGGTQSGQIEFDLTSGLSENADIEQGITGTVSANDMEVSMDIKSFITISMTEKK